jgi:hypothetical protein
MATSPEKIATRIVIPLAAVVALVASSVVAAPPAFAGGIFADVLLFNETQSTIWGITAHLDSANCFLGIGSNGSHWVQSPPNPGTAPNQPDGSPPVVLGPGQSVGVRTESNDGICPSGTGGNMQLPGADPLTFTWSSPQPSFSSGCIGDEKDSGGPGSFAILSGGGVSQGPDPGGWACEFRFGLTPKPPPPAPLPLATNRLNPGQALSRGVPGNNSITESTSVGITATYKLTLGDDGNLVDNQHWCGPVGVLPHLHLRCFDAIVWSSQTNDASVAYMQPDGNFVLRDPAGNAVWQSNTAGNPDAFVTPIGNDLIGNTLVPAVMGGAGFGGPVWSGRNCGQRALCQ